MRSPRRGLETSRFYCGEHLPLEMLKRLSLDKLVAVQASSLLADEFARCISSSLKQCRVPLLPFLQVALLSFDASVTPHGSSGYYAPVVACGVFR